MNAAPAAMIATRTPCVSTPKDTTTAGASLVLQAMGASVSVIPQLLSY